MSDKPAAAPKEKKRGGKGIVGLFVALLMAIGAIALLPTTLIVVVGMLPTAAAYLIDSTRDKTFGTTVLFLNFAGVMPSLLKLWQEGHIVSNALDILTQPYMLLLILLPTGFAWVLFAYVPLFISSVMRRNAEGRIRNLEKEQEFLLSKWGNAMIGSPAAPVKSLPAPEDESALV